VRLGGSTGQAASLVEREAVLATLADQLASAVRGMGRVVLLSGEAGVGKSAVLGRFARESTSVVEISRGWCEPLSTPRPLGPWADMAADLGVSVVAELDRSDPELGVSRLFRAVLAALQTGGPRVLIIEDVHWADAASLDLLRLLARRIGRLPVLLVASYRDDEIGPDHPLRMLLGDLAGVPAVHRCRVEPLSPGAVAGLAAGHGVNVDVDELYRITGGNPFFVTEVLAAGGGGIPRTIGDAIAGRLARVSPAASRVAELIAVLGSPAPIPVVAALVEDATDRMTELAGAGVLVPVADGLGFRHELIRMAVLDGIPAFERVACHARVLKRLHSDPAHHSDQALLAHHAESAHDGAAVLRYAPKAADEALRSGAHREAAAQWARALRFGATLPSDQRAMLLERFAQASALSSRVSDAVEALGEAVELRAHLDDRLREGDTMRWLSWLLWPTGRCAEAERIGHRGVRVLERLPASRELAWAYVNMCQLMAYNERGVALAEDYAERATSLAERFDDLEAAAQARFHLALSRYVSDDDREVESWSDMLCARKETFDAGFVDAAAFMANMEAIYSATHRDHGRTADAGSFLETLSQERDIQSLVCSGRAQQARSLFHQGLWEDAAELASWVADQPGALPVARVMALYVLGLVRARRGDPGAEQTLDEAARIFEPAAWPLLVLAARAEAAWLVGDHERSLAEARRGLDVTTPHTDPWIAGELARWVVLAGGEMPSVRAAEPFALELARDWRGAAAAWERLGCPYDAAMARLAGDVPALLTALQTFDSLGARPAADRARTRLRALGVRSGLRGPRPTTRANPHGLTSRQVEILDLVAQGLTDAQVAARLQLSAKTVNHHVGAVLAKLGVHTRTEAVRKLVGP
jgi:DNA-binding CsgD family transcriptional regulator